MKVLAIILFTSLWSCGSVDGNQDSHDTASGPQDPEADPNDEDAVPDGPGGSTGDAGDDAGADGVDDVDDVDDDVDDIDDIEGGGGDGLKEVLESCGVPENFTPDTQMVNQSMTGLKIVQEGSIPLAGNYYIEVTPKVDINSTVARSISSTAFDIATDDVRGSVAANRIALRVAEKRTEENQGKVTTTFVPSMDRPALADKDPSWDGVLCVVQPGALVLSEIGGLRVSTEFDPPVPSSVSPRPTHERYFEEMAQERTWNDIVATVRESTDDRVPTGYQVTGTVTVRQISPNFTTRDHFGNPVDVSADIAFEITQDFGGAEITNALGLKPLTRFYIDYQSKTFNAIISDVQDGETDPVILLP